MTTEKYFLGFWHRIEKSTKRKVFIGTLECGKYGIPTSTALFSRARTHGKTLYGHHQRASEQQARIRTRAEVTWQKYHHLHNFHLTEFSQMVHARDLANTIYDLPSRWTGWQSEDSINSNERVEEHFFPRMWAGEIMLKYFLTQQSNATVDDVVMLFEIFRQVHHVTAKENQLLRPHQLSSQFTTWEEAYKQAKVSPLVHIDNRGGILTPDEAAESLVRR
jgi:hypothetical protein